MRSAAGAIAWEFRRRHKWPLLAMGVYLMLLAAIKLLGYDPAVPIRLVPPDGRAAALIAPLSTTYFYCLAIFSFGLAGDLGARESIFPARMFTLPVKTDALVFWPMLYGAATVALLWLGAGLVARWPWHIEVPLIWPALFAAAFLAWTQALTWLPYGLPGIRAIVTVLWLAAFDAIILLAIHFKAGEPLMIALLAPQLPLANLVARFAVARARRGDVPDWRGAMSRPAVSASAAGTRAAPFHSARRAQVWLEWRSHGRSLPGVVGIVLPFELALLWLARDAAAFVELILVIVLLTPPLMAAFSTTTHGNANPSTRDSRGVSPFIATRPLTSAGLIAAKLEAAVWSTLATWLLVAVAVPLALTLSGTWPAVTARASRLIELVGMPRAAVFGLLVICGLMASTWKQLVQSMFIGLTGRAWIIRSSVVLALVFIVVAGPALQYVAGHKTVQAAIWVALPAICAALAVLKVLAGGWAAARLSAARLVGDRALVGGASAWLAAVLALYGVLAWLVSGPLVRRYFLILVATLAIPLARLSAAPLAFAWNRHR